MSNILFCYKNLCEAPSKITDLYGTSSSLYGTNRLADNNLSSYWSSNSITNANILFDMGSNVYVDSLIAVHNLTGIGTLYVNAGDTNPPTTIAYGLPILGSTGTSMNFFTPIVNYRYWQLFFEGVGLTEVTKIKEVFIGKRDVLSVNPQYPFRTEMESSTILTESEKGQKKVYLKYTKRSWEFDYPSVNEATFGTLNKIRNFCNGSYRPLWFCLDKDDNKFETFFARFEKNSFKQKEIFYGVHDVSFRLNEEL